jgi:site-specific recombinase XerD
MQTTLGFSAPRELAEYLKKKKKNKKKKIKITQVLFHWRTSNAIKPKGFWRKLSHVLFLIHCT